MIRETIRRQGWGEQHTTPYNEVESGMANLLTKRVLETLRGSTGHPFPSDSLANGSATTDRALSSAGER